MGSLYSSLTIAVGALQAEQGALNITSNNVANINTPGYARQRAVLAEGIPLVLAPLVFGSGVVFDQPESVRDNILELRLQEETQQQGQFDAQVQQLQQAQTGFTGTNDVGTQLTNFFNSLNQLSADPSNVSLRQSVLTAAGNHVCMPIMRDRREDCSCSIRLGGKSRKSRRKSRRWTSRSSIS